MDMTRLDIPLDATQKIVVATTAPRRSRIRQWLDDANLASKVLLATGMVMIPALVATVTLLGYASYLDQLASFETELEVQAKVAAENVSAAVLFDNRAETRDILRGVFTPTSIVEAQIYNVSGASVSGYQLSGAGALMLPDSSDASRPLATAGKLSAVLRSWPPCRRCTAVSKGKFSARR
jgi:hypothetical protein